ncbi:hypothetical protein AC1031_020375 [Aphanomyces cochlioides]|nr:hypothetical protein AC1031_020375 [Aphanomyces cochlioides]
MPTFTCLADPEQGRGYGAFYSDGQGHLGCKAYIIALFPPKWEDYCVFYKSASECEAGKNSLLPLTTNHAFYDLNQYTQGMKNLLNTIINPTTKPTPAPSTTAKTSAPSLATPSSKAPSTPSPPASSSSAPKTPQPSSSNAPPAVSPPSSSPTSTSSGKPPPSPSVVSPQTTAGSTSVPSSTSSTTIAPSTTTESPTESPPDNSTTVSPSYIDVSIPPSSQASTEWYCIAQGPMYTPVRINAESGQFECLATETSDSDCYHLDDYSKCTIWLKEQETCLASNSCLQGVHVKIVQGVTATTTSSAYSTPSTTLGTSLDVPGSPGNSSSSPLVTIVLGVVCAALAIAAILGFVLWRRRQRQDDDEQFTPKNSPMLLMTEKGIVLKQLADLEDATAVGGAVPASPMPSRSTISSQGASQPLDMGDLSLWRLDNAKLTKTKVLSVGTTGTVSLGLYKGHQAVAIKQLFPHQSDEIAQGFIDEIKRMTKLESPYILAMVGCCWVRPREIELVTEYMENGDLRQYLDKTTPINYPWKAKRSCISNLTQGLVYLHSMDIIHRDLKSRNVLLDAKLHAKLADFGVCRDMTMETMTCGLGSFRWTAPEILQGKRYSQAADIYALGMIVWELDSHQPPYATQQKALHITDVVVMSKITKGELSPEFTPSCPRHVVSFVHQCIAQDPDQRPTALDLASLLLEQESVSL